MKPKFILSLAVLAALLTGCFKEVSHKTNYVLKPLIQNLSGEATQPLEGVKAYAFAADTADYTVATYADAEAGVLTRRTNPAEKLSEPTAVAEPFAQEGTTGWLQMSLGRTSQLVLAVDTQNKLYAYTQQTLAVNLPKLYVSLIFKPWKEGTSYTEGKWLFFNEFYTTPTYITCYIEPSAQATEGGEQSSISSLKAYAYAADTTAWRIASYDDAVAGKITSKSDDSFTRTTPNFQAYKESDSERYKMEKVNSSPLMVVVVDRVNRLYAYTKREVELTATDTPSFPIVFRLWRNEWKYDEQGWQVVNPALAPNTETTTNR